MKQHSLIWIILIAVCFIGMPAISSSQSIMQRVILELDMIEKALGKTETSNVTKSATDGYLRLFVATGLVQSTGRAMVSEEEKRQSEDMFGQSMRAVSNQTNDYIVGFSALCFASLVRLAIFVAWLPYLAPFFLAVGIDAFVARRIKFASFGYSSPITFSAASHILIVMFFLPVLYLVAPLPVTPLFIPFWALLSSVPLMAVVANLQRV